MEIRVLGPVELVGAEGPIGIRATKQRQLLAALALDPGVAHSVDALIAAVWGESPPASAAKLLQVYVSQLRKVLPAPSQILTTGPGYALDLGGGTLDSRRFEELVDDGRDMLARGNPALASSILQRALRLWRGEAFGSFRYETFAREETARLEELREICAEERFAAELELGHHEQVLPELRAHFDLHPTRERGLELVMLALYRSGRQADALAAYAEAREHLRDELGLEPGPGPRALQRRILEQGPELAVAPSAHDLRHRPPAAPSALIGRGQELDELESLIAGHDARLIVLSGAGGSGKSRLALAAAHRCEAYFANGAAYVALAPVRDPGLVLSTISRVLEIDERVGKSPLETLIDGLADRELLLVIDNAEHLRAAAPEYVELLAHAPRLTLLVTSRIVLHLSGEHVYPVLPLSEPYAIALFRERARQAEPRFDPNDASDDVIARIAGRLDGLPLALELAASRIRSLTLEQLFARLDLRLPLLTGGPHDLPARQQTLRATIEWSHELLASPEQHLLARLAVFAGGWTLDAAIEVAVADLDTLQTLVENNLVVHDGGRYSMLETIREYAAEQLAVLGETADVERRHAQHFLALAEEVEPRLEAAGQAKVLELLERELPNLRAALAWSSAAKDPLGVRLASALRSFWFKRGHLGEGRRWLADALAVPANSDGARTKALFAAALLATMQADWSESKRLSTACAALGRDLRDTRFVALSLVTLGRALLGEGDTAGAAASFEEATTLATQNHDSATLALARLNRGYLALSAGELSRADEELVAAETEFAARGDESGVARSLAGRGSVAIHEHRNADAVALLRASIAAARTGGDHENIAWPLQLLGIAEAEARPADAAVLLGAAEKLRSAIGLRLQGIELSLHEGAVAALRDRLDEERLDAAWATGRELQLDEALDAVLYDGR